MSAKILFVDDEAGLRLTVGDRLRSEGYAVETASDGAEGFQKAGDGGYDLIVLDVMMPGKNGYDVCRDLRAQGVRTPILMLTARGQLVDKVLGLKIGADDYLTKPFEAMELLARVEALLRRAGDSAPVPASTYEFGDVRVDFKRTEVYRGEEELSLSAKEYHLLKYFIEHAGETVSRDALLHEVWGYESTPSTRTVDVHVAWLRQKVEEDPKKPQWIQTIHGLGYKFLG